LVLVDDINNNLEKFSIQKDERKFKSHLTLLRLKNKESKNFIKSFENFVIPEINFIIDEAALIKSELLPDSSKYTEIKKYKLK
jgi:2'-5' RNA ligase